MFIILYSFKFIDYNLILKETLKNVHELYQKVDRLLDDFELLKNDNKKLLENLNSLKINLENKKVEVNEFKSKYESLKLAKSITLDGEKKLAKKKIKKMIDDIDDCIINIIG